MNWRVVFVVVVLGVILLAGVNAKVYIIEQRGNSTGGGSVGGSNGETYYFAPYCDANCGTYYDGGGT